MPSNKMTRRELRAAVSLAGIFGLRMLGLFMILPVFALYAEHLEGVTPLLVGLAIGIYGATQALLQIPFGMLSDRLGRKSVITVGLLIFASGSVVAASSTTIEGVILGRALQGAGAIAAAVMALTADLTREEHRTKAMAIIGMTIGLSFLVAMVAGPLLDGWIGVPGIFWLTAALSLGGIAVLHLTVPNPLKRSLHRDTEPVPAQFKSVLTNSELLRLNFGILVLHMVLTASFVVLPLALRDAGFAGDKHWQLYLPVMAGAMALAIPFIIVAEKKRVMKQVVVGAVGLLGAAELVLAEFHGSFWTIAGLVLLFFTAFNLLEAMLPSLVAKVAPADSKGTAMGVYSSSQFIGAFIGGAAGGWLFQHYGYPGVFAFCASVISLWLLLAYTMRQPHYLSTQMISVGPVDDARAAELERLLAQVTGVAEVAVHPGEGVAYLKVDKQTLDPSSLRAFTVSES